MVYWCKVVIVTITTRAAGTRAPWWWHQPSYIPSGVVNKGVGHVPVCLSLQVFENTVQILKVGSLVGNHLYARTH
jgi:hypothetical protein